MHCADGPGVGKMEERERKRVIEVKGIRFEQGRTAEATIVIMR
jgi:hypothetical protein